MPLTGAAAAAQAEQGRLNILKNTHISITTFSLVLLRFTTSSPEKCKSYARQ